MRAEQQPCRPLALLCNSATSQAVRVAMIAALEVLRHTAHSKLHLEIQQLELSQRAALLEELQTSLSSDQADDTEEMRIVHGDDRSVLRGDAQSVDQLLPDNQDGSKE